MSIIQTTFEAQGAVVRVSVKSPSGGAARPRSGAVRGVISSFSRRSRSRLLERMARLEARGATFLTLTYGQVFPSPKNAKNHLRALLERFRRLAPESSGVWRLEPQRRGAPHFHLILYGLPYIPKEDIATAWLEIIGDEYGDWSSGAVRAPFTRIERIRSRRGVMAYTSKYVAKCKTDDDDDENSVLSWLSAAALGGFNYVPYLHATLLLLLLREAIIGAVWAAPGRWWGIFNRDYLPYDELLSMVAYIDESTFHKFRRGMAKIWRNAASGGRYRGGMLFVNNSHRWFDFFLHCMMS